MSATRSSRALAAAVAIVAALGVGVARAEVAPTTANFTCTTTSTTPVARVSHRTSVTLENAGSTRIYVSHTCPATTGAALFLEPGATWYVSKDDGAFGAICCITSSSTGDLRVDSAFYDPEAWPSR